MRVIDSSYEICSEIDGKKILINLEKAGRTCYKSEGNIGEGTAEKFIRNVIKRGHESVLEHEKITVRFICDRGVTHEMVRHRLASYSQESSRYCNYSQDKFSNEITFIKPRIPMTQEQYYCWSKAMNYAEKSYFDLIANGAKPDLARGVLPTDVKTEIVMSCNLREWRHFFKMRCDSAAHPNIRYLARELCTELKRLIPVIFDDIIWDEE
jgi:thymidylate synthase (FAD)